MRISLRSLFIVFTLAVLATPSIVEWWNTPTEIELVEEFCRLIDEGRYSDAREIANLTMDIYPDSEVAQTMENKAFTLIVLLESHKLKWGIYGFTEAVDSKEKFDDDLPRLRDELSQTNAD